MAKATTSVSDPIWLGEALRHVQAAGWSRELAEIKLRRWLVTGELPWTCRIWAGRQKYTSTGLVPADGVSRGEPLFFSNADIDWDNSRAREASIPLGAQAVGVQVSRSRLLELLFGAPAELQEPKNWWADVRKHHPRQRNELTGAYARRLHALMQTADVTEVWPLKTLRRRLYDK